MSKNVYLIHVGCRYEGGRIDSVYSTLKKARTAALILVEKANKENDEQNSWSLENDMKYVEEHPDVKIEEIFDPKPKYKETSENYWTDEMDYIMIIEMPVL